MRTLLSIIFILYGLLGMVSLGFVIESLLAVLTNEAAQLSRGVVLLSLAEMVLGTLGVGSMVGFFTRKQWGRLIGLTLTALIFLMIAVNILVVMSLQPKIENYSIAVLIFGLAGFGLIFGVLLRSQWSGKESPGK
jgi:hypothetical protein